MPTTDEGEHGPIDDHEQTPLLGNDHTSSPVDLPKRGARWQATSPTAVVALVSIIKFAIVATGMMMLLPLYRLVEDSLCHVYYDDGSTDMIDEMQCKVDEVQSRLAILMGWFGLSSSIIGLLVAFPFGTLADKIGRKPTVMLSYCTMALSFLFGPLLLAVFKKAVRRNPYILILGQLFQLFGGSVQVLLSLLYAIAADVSDEKTKATSFLCLTFGATLGGLIGPLTAGFLMDRYGPWVCIEVVVCTSPVVLAMFFFLPETGPVQSKTVQLKNDRSDATFREHIGQGIADLKICLTLLKEPNIPLILVTFLSQNARLTAYTGTLLQYISKHFGWSLARTNILLSPLGILNLLVLIALPWISRYLTGPRVGWSSFRKDLFLTKISTLLLIFGALIEGFSHNLVLFLIGLFINTFGAADSPLARATISHYVDGEFTSRLYALISMAEVIGAFIGGPVLAFFFTKGLEWKGYWIGLPWFYIAFVCIICWVALLFVRAPKTAAQRDPVLRDDDEAQIASRHDRRDEN